MTMNTLNRQAIFLTNTNIEAYTDRQTDTGDSQTNVHVFMFKYVFIYIYMCTCLYMYFYVYICARYMRSLFGAVLFFRSTEEEEGDSTTTQNGHGVKASPTEKGRGEARPSAVLGPASRYVGSSLQANSNQVKSRNFKSSFVKLHYKN